MEMLLLRNISTQQPSRNNPRNHLFLFLFLFLLSSSGWVVVPPWYCCEAYKTLNCPSLTVFLVFLRSPWSRPILKAEESQHNSYKSILLRPTTKHFFNLERIFFSVCAYPSSPNSECWRFIKWIFFYTLILGCTYCLKPWTYTKANVCRWTELVPITRHQLTGP